MSTRTNNLLHLSILLLLLSLVRQENRQALAGVLREHWQTWTLLAAFFIYYALSNVWGHTPQHIDSPITHGVYLTGYLLLMTMLLRDGRTRRLAMLAVVGGITVLSLWTLIIDHTLVLTERAVSPENPGPTNVIDLAGYCGIGILICGMLLKEKASHWLYLPVVIMLVMLLLTQSRGPIIALVLAVGCTLHLHVFTRRNLLIAVIEDPTRHIIQLRAGETRNECGAIRRDHAKFWLIGVPVQLVSKEDNFRIVKMGFIEPRQRSLALYNPLIKRQPLLGRLNMCGYRFTQRYGFIRDILAEGRFRDVGIVHMAHVLQRHCH